MGHPKSLRHDDYTAWLAEGEALAQRAKGNQWAVGDWWAKGGAYGERTKQGAKLFGGIYTIRTLETYGSVASRVKTTTRVVALSFKHHELVAPMSPEDQELWLGKAEANGWSVAKLRAEIKAATPPEHDKGPSVPP